MSDASGDRLLLQTQQTPATVTPAPVYAYVPPALPSTPVTELNCVIAAGQPG
eukprot:CAMPEP_0202684614 /NCGR_PEP_ID=MMETSP1385-20130828/137_1 /ASSEMBLY_ACC=CAM_ASM_000861 /TAXON_ID=933848 /ORGANISM="Elphidium margaritaceum" /LENGTH=51 /DNA_ID=CAMNT_0049338797 /DNA_START=1 /DNA_END=152 /DNA_ORIENTATION=-